MSTVRIESPPPEAQSAPDQEQTLPQHDVALPASWDRSARRGLLILDAIFLTISISLVLLVPGGGWKNSTMGVSLWWNGDPGVGYLVGSLYVFTPDRQTFAGHPGLPIEIIVGIFTKLIHIGYRIGGGQESIYQFWARNMRGLFILGGVIISIIHVISFHVLFALAKRLVNDPRAALLAVIAYATSFPLLHYATRLSPEPLLVMAFALTILALWNLQARLDDGNRRAAYRWAALAGFTSVAAIYIKIHMGFALPAMACAQLLLQRGATSERIGERIRARGKLLGPFFLTGLATALLGLLKVDWPWFFDWWHEYVPGNHQARGAAHVPLGGPIRGFFITSRDNLGKFLPRMTQEGVFAIVEGVFVIVAVAALIWFWRKKQEKRALLIWPLLYCALVTPIILYRGLWHYVFLHLAIGVAPLALMIWELIGRFISRPRFAAALAVILLLHSISLVFFLSGRVSDLRKYHKFVRAYHVALNHIKPGQRIAAIAPDGIPPRLLYGYWPEWISGGEEFKSSLNDMIVQVKSPKLLTDQFINEKKIVMVVARKGLATRAFTVRAYKAMPASKENERGPHEPDEMREHRDQ